MNYPLFFGLSLITFSRLFKSEASKEPADLYDAYRLKVAYMALIQGGESAQTVGSPCHPHFEELYHTLAEYAGKNVETILSSFSNQANPQEALLQKRNDLQINFGFLNNLCSPKKTLICHLEKKVCVKCPTAEYKLDCEYIQKLSVAVDEEPVEPTTTPGPRSVADLNDAQLIVDVVSKLWKGKKEEGNECDPYLVESIDLYKAIAPYFNKAAEQIKDEFDQNTTIVDPHWSLLSVKKNFLRQLVTSDELCSSEQSLVCHETSNWGKCVDCSDDKYSNIKYCTELNALKSTKKS